MPALSLRVKLMATVAVVMVVSSLAMAFFIQSRMSEVLGAELNQRGIAIAHELAAQSVDLVLTYNTYQLHELAHTIQASNRDVRYVFIVDAKGGLLVHTFENGFPEDLRHLRGLDSGEEFRTLLLRTDEGPLLDVAVPIYEGKAGTAHLGMSYEQVWRTINDTLRWLLSAGGVALVFVLGLTHVSVRMVLRPLSKLMVAAQEVGRGNLHYRVGIRSRDEIGRFGAAFDSMAEELEQSREAAARLQMDKMRSEFLARASHELRTPVAAIQGYVETLMREDMGLDRATLRTLFQDMEQISDRLNRLVNDLLSISRIDMDEFKVNRKPVTLGPLVSRAIRRFEMQAPDRTFDIQIPSGLPQALTDPDLLDDVLDNLLSNAVKYSPTSASISVAARLQADNPRPRQGIVDHMLEVSVTDEGIGIPNSELDRVFQRFYQRSDGDMPRRRGIGLGLYLCRHYVEAMGGTIWVKSQHGKGSSFGFTLPVATDAFWRMSDDHLVGEASGERTNQGTEEGGQNGTPLSRDSGRRR